MIAFVISVNGKRCCTIGIEGEGVLTSHVTGVIMAGISNVEGAPLNNGLDFHAGGLDSTTQDHLRWNVPEVQIGDRIEIEIVETDKVDPPSERGPGEYTGKFPVK